MKFRETVKNVFPSMSVVFYWQNQYVI
jgi:hypothetical protein